MSLYLITSAQPSSDAPVPADIIIIDTRAQPTKNIQLLLTGSIEVDVFGSIEPDSLQPDLTKKNYCLHIWQSFLVSLIQSPAATTNAENQKLVPLMPRNKSDYRSPLLSHHLTT